MVNNGTHFLAEMQSALARLDVDYDLVPGYELLTADVLSSYSGVILTGGDVHVYEPTGLVAAALDEQILTLVTTPILGICLGHQLIAHHWGATIEALRTPIDRHEVVEIVRDDLLFAGLAPRVGVRVAHDDAVTALAAPLVRLARSRFSEYEAIRHPTRLVYGLQFHPEASGDTGLTILDNFVRLCSDPPTDEPPATAVEGSG